MLTLGKQEKRPITVFLEEGMGYIVLCVSNGTERNSILQINKKTHKIQLLSKVQDEYGFEMTEDGFVVIH